MLLTISKEQAHQSMIKDPNTGLVTSTSCPHPLRQFLRPTIIEFDAFEPMNRSFKLTFGPSLTVFFYLRGDDYNQKAAFRRSNESSIEVRASFSVRFKTNRSFCAANIECDLDPFLLPLTREEFTVQLPLSGFSREDRCSAFVTATLLALDAFGKEAVLEEADLHKRYPTIFPRFYHAGFSAFLRVDDDELAPDMEYIFFEIPIRSDYTSKIDDSAVNDDDLVPPSKRSKRSESSGSSALLPAKKLKIGVPTSFANIFGLSSDVWSRLEDSTRPIRAITGFIVSLLGGAIQLSYPPTLEEAAIYCHIICIYEYLGLDAGDLVATLSTTLKALYHPQPVPIPAYTAFAEDLFELVWIECSCNATCLAMLAPMLPSESDHIRLGERLGAHITSNISSFIKFTHWHANHHLATLKKEMLKRKETTIFDEFAGLEPVAETTLSDTELIQHHIKPGFTSHESGSSTRTLAKFWKKGIFCDGKTKFKCVDTFSPDEAIPSTAVCISSSKTSANSDKSPKKRFLAHYDLLRLRWPYFDRMMKSGLSEFHTRKITLPVSENVIEHLLGSIYLPYSVDCIEVMQEEDAIDVLERGHEFGWYTDLVLEYDEANIPFIDSYGEAPSFKRLMNSATYTLFSYNLSDDSVVEALNLAHSFELHAWIDSILNCENPKVPWKDVPDLGNLYHEVRKKYDEAVNKEW